MRPPVVLGMKSNPGKKMRFIPPTAIHMTPWNCATDEAGYGKKSERTKMLFEIRKYESPGDT